MELENINNSPSFSDLPLHVIEHIQAYLPMYDFLCSSITCQQWFAASKHPRFRKRIKLAIGNDMLFERLTNPTNLFLASTRIYENLILDYVELNNNDLPFFQQHGMNIKQLTIKNISLDYQYFIQILNCLPSLEKLTLAVMELGADFLKFDHNEALLGFKNLKSLQLNKCYNFAGDILTRITRLIPNLELFSMIECTGEYNDKDCFNFMNNNRRTLKSLCSGHYFFDSLFKNGPVTIDELDLNELWIESKKVSPAVQFILTQKNLKKLVVVSELMPEQIKLICDSLHKLESLTYCGDDLPSKSIRNLKNLKELYLILDDVDDLSVIEACRNDTLQVLQINRSKITETLSPLFVNLQNLREFNIFIDEEMEIDIFQLIFKYMINLEDLEIVWNGEGMNATTNDTNLYDIGRLNKLKRLTFNFEAENIPGYSLEHLMKLKNLTSLTFYQDAAITYSDQIRLMQSLPLLENVNFYGWEGIDPEVILENGPRLNRLSKENLSKM